MGRSEKAAMTGNAKVTVIAVDLPRAKGVDSIDLQVTPRDGAGAMVNPGGISTVQYILWFQGDGGGVHVFGGGKNHRYHADDPESAILRDLFGPRGDRRIETEAEP